MFEKRTQKYILSDLNFFQTSIYCRIWFFYHYFNHWWLFPLLCDYDKLLNTETNSDLGIIFYPNIKVHLMLNNCLWLFHLIPCTYIVYVLIEVYLLTNFKFNSLIWYFAGNFLFSIVLNSYELVIPRVASIDRFPIKVRYVKQSSHTTNNQ